MAYLREMVEKQKTVLINNLISEGYTDNPDELTTKTLTEIINEYDAFTITKESSKNNSLRFTRSIQINKKSKPH